MALTQVKSDGIADGAVTTNDLSDSGVTAGTYGSSSAIPAITVDAKGRVTSATTSAIDSTSIANGTSNVSVAASGDITVTRSGTVVGTFSSGGLDVPNGITANKIVVDDDGASSPTMVVKSDDNATTGFVVKNDTYSTNEEVGFKINQGNDGTVAVMNVGNSEYKGINFQTINSSGGVKNAIVVNPEASVDLYYNNGVKLQTQSGGINVTGTVTCDGLTCEGSATIVSGDGVFFLKDSNSTGTATQCYISGRDSANSEVWYVGQTSGGSAAVDIVNTQNASIFFGTNNTYRAYFGSAGHFVPYASNTYDLGSTGQRWRNIYTNDLNLSNEGGANDVDGTWGSWTIQEGEDELFLLNRRNGKKYKFNLSEVN
jgi:hypothetical protein